MRTNITTTALPTSSTTNTTTSTTFHHRRKRRSHHHHHQHEGEEHQHQHHHHIEGREEAYHHHHHHPNGSISPCPDSCPLHHYHHRLESPHHHHHPFHHRECTCRSQQHQHQQQLHHNHQLSDSNKASQQRTPEEDQQNQHRPLQERQLQCQHQNPLHQKTPLEELKQSPLQHRFYQYQTIGQDQHEQQTNQQHCHLHDWDQQEGLRDTQRNSQKEKDWSRTKPRGAKLWKPNSSSSIKGEQENYRSSSTRHVCSNSSQQHEDLCHPISSEVQSSWFSQIKQDHSAIRTSEDSHPMLSQIHQGQSSTKSSQETSIFSQILYEQTSTNTAHGPCPLLSQTSQETSPARLSQRQQKQSANKTSINIPMFSLKNQEQSGTKISKETSNAMFSQLQQGQSRTKTSQNQCPTRFSQLKENEFETTPTQDPCPTAISQLHQKDTETNASQDPCPTTLSPLRQDPSETKTSLLQPCPLLAQLTPLRLLLLVAALLQAGALGCRISEFTCGNYECVPADAYCDGEPDCSDRTDEPRDCSPCNRTFYGDVGKSYTVSVLRPQDMTTTFTCHLTFVAEGDQYGDIVQLIIQDFKLGDFFSYNSGCPQGWMQISERDRPYTDGYWCGNSQGYNVYYSETSTTTLTLKKFITMDYIHFEGLHQSPFNFRLTYKTLRSSDAVLRYGNATSPKDRGELTEGSLCDRIFLNCDEYLCSVQSPNFPGLYPRHVTCHYLLRQTRYVPYARPLITVYQDNPLRFNVKSTSALPNSGPSSPGLQIWGSCDLVHDHLLVYDGNSTSAPLLLKFCGSGQLPPITSTGSEMLLVFSTSRFDEPTQETLMPRTFGFELDVKITYLNMDSRQYARNRNCVFHIFGANNSSGEVKSVVNTQPQNTSCVYLFHGEPHEVVWVHFRKYEINPKMGHYSFNMTECINPLRIYDGNFFDTNTPYGSPRRARLIQEHCTARPPPMCAREYLPPRVSHITPVKACTRNESYVASGPKLTVVQHYNESTAALAMDFVLRYEFVNTRPGYHPTNGSECDFEDISDGYSLRTGRVFSPRTSVLYGRWGRRKLSCQYRLTAHRDEVVRVTITKFHSMSRSCVTTKNNFTGSNDCDNQNGLSASLVVSEYPWQDIEVPRLCTCDYSYIPIEYESKSQELRLKFEVNNMDETHDFMDFMFEAQYEFVKKSSCKKEQRLQGTNGEIIFRKANLTENKPCDNYPWLLQTSDAKKSIYFRIRGYDHTDKNCTTNTRLLVFKVGRLRPVGVLCPDPTSKKVVELYSFAWQGSGTLVEQSTDKLVLEVLTRDGLREQGPHTLTWLQVSPARQYDWSSEGIVKGCMEECPELAVCISEDLWCDGVHHCPSGHDELIAHCFFLSVPWAYIGVGSALSVILLVAVTVYGAARLRQADKKTHNHQPIPTLPTASESLFSSDKDAAERDGGVTSAYSLDYSEVDYVTTL